MIKEALYYLQAEDSERDKRYRKEKVVERAAIENSTQPPRLSNPAAKSHCCPSLEKWSLTFNSSWKRERLCEVGD